MTRKKPKPRHALAARDEIPTWAYRTGMAAAIGVAIWLTAGLVSDLKKSIDSQSEIRVDISSMRKDVERIEKSQARLEEKADRFERDTRKEFRDIREKLDGKADK